MSTQSSSGGFNFDTQPGIAHVLASVRSAEISTEQKNDLRDTIFLYTNGGRDQTVKLSLEQKLATYGVVPAGPVPNTAPAPQSAIPSSPIGSGRSAPGGFSVSAPAPVTPAPAAQPTPAPAPTQQPAAPAPVTPPPAPAPAPVTPAPAAQPVTPPPVPTQAPAPQSQPAPAAPVQNPDVYLGRIREIKAMVNEKVGNPVNLVDIDNEVGREYMGALLDAMKKINSGASAVSAMQRLETAFSSVEKAIEAHQASGGQSVTPTPSPQPVTPPPAPAPKPTPMPVSEPAPQPSPAPAPAPQPAAPAPVTPSPAPVPEPTPAPASAPVPPPAPKPEPAQTSVPVTPPPAPAPKPVAPKPAPVPEPATPEKSNRVPIQEVSTPQPTPKPDTDEARWANNSLPKSSGTEAVPPKPNAAEPVTKVSSLAEKLSSNEVAKEANKPAEKKPAAGDPLYTPEIDNGLDQLLSEWSLFKKSGLFGTGPKGREHPLFMKIAGLQIPLLLAGRFEGATQEIKQSITDYMNGWRYEQGIVYTQGETFERYLRRVIKHIIDLQKKKPAA